MTTLAIKGNPLGLGDMTLVSPNSSLSQTLTLPDSTGNVVVDVSTQTLTNKTLGAGTVTATSLITSGTAQASTSGVAIDFTGIPSWVKRITVMFRQVSTSGTSPVWLQIGTSGGVETSSYDNSVSNLTGSVTTAQSTGNAAFILDANNTATSSNSGSITLSLISSNTWASVGLLVNQSTGAVKASAGSKALSGVLDRVRITTANGTDAFDAGTINIMYE